MSSGTVSEGGVLDHITVQRTLVASATVLVYDILCTLDVEVKYVWSRPQASSTILFFLNRYLPLVDTFLSLALTFDNDISPENCRKLFSVVTCFIVVGTLISEAILMLRTYAIWERRRSILLILAGVALGLYIPGIIVTIIEVQSLRFALNDTVFSGCHVVHASMIIFIAYVLLVIAETVMIVLTMIQAYRYMREHSRTDWIASMYRTGVLYYFYLLAVSLANILVPLLAPPPFANWLATPQRVVHSILCTRLLLFIFRQRTATSFGRLSAQHMATDTSSQTAEQIEFTTLQFDNEGDSETDLSFSEENMEPIATQSGSGRQWQWRQRRHEPP